MQGVDIGEQCSVDRAEGQPSSAAVCRKAGEDRSLHDQREVADT